MCCEGSIIKRSMHEDDAFLGGLTVETVELERTSNIRKEEETEHWLIYLDL